MKVAVVGGGPAGIATLKFLATAHTFFPIPPIEVRLFEAGDEIGGTFVQRVYEDAEMVSSKYLTAFSDFRLPLDAPDFVTPQVYVQYLRDYLTHFNLWPHVRTSARVSRIVRRQPAGGHTMTITAVDTGMAEDWDCDAVAICTGIHVHPRVPEIPGLDRVPTVLHSSRLITRAQFGAGKHVVVLGAGETGMDMAHLAITSPTASVTLCHREGFFCAPKIIPLPNPRGRAAQVGARPNKPVDTSVASLFDTAYAHPVLQRSPLPWFAYDLWVRKMHWCISGTEEGPDQWVGQMSKERKHLNSLFMCKSDRALPYISANHRSTSLLNRIRSRILNVPIRSNHGKAISVRRWPESVDDDGVMHFTGEAGPSKVDFKPDMVVLATGYTTSFPMLDHSRGPYPTLQDAADGIRGVYSTSVGGVDVGYIGFVRPSIGAIPPLAEMQAQLWTLRLLQSFFPEHVPATRSKNAVEGYEMDYKLHPRCGYDVWADKRGVDHESYAYQLALDMGAAPTLAHVSRKGWRCFYAWAMGSNFNPKFRMVGPWRDEAVAEGIMRGELYSVVRRSGGVVYLLTYTIIPLAVFGSISVSLYAAFWVASLPGKVVAGLKNLFGWRSKKSKVSQKILA